jgi:hypothetical protein
MAMRDVVERFVAVSASHADSSNFRRDLVDVVKTWLGAIVDRFLEQALLTGDLASRYAFFEALGDLDRLLATRPEHRVSSWLTAARRCAANSDEQLYLERSARTLISWWGGPFLFDYATREWAGLILDFHAPRWRLWFEWLDAKAPLPDFAEWEKSWSESVRHPVESTPEPEIHVVKAMLAKYGHRCFSPDSPLQVTRLEPQPAREGAVDVDLGRPKTLLAVACIPSFGQGFRGRYRVEASLDDIQWHELDTSRAAPETTHGVRACVPFSEVRYLRFRIDPVLGSKDQRFQVVLFEPATSDNTA